MKRPPTSRISSVRRSGRKPSRFARISFKVLAVCVGLLIACMVAAKLARPYLISYGESKEIQQIKQQIAQAEAENRALKRDIGYLKKPSGMETEARKLGWVKAGEVSIVVEPGPGDEQEDGGFAQPQVPESMWQAATRRVLRLFVRERPSR